MSFTGPLVIALTYTRCLPSRPQLRTVSAWPVAAATLALCVGAAPPSAAAEGSARGKPNVIVVTVDDQSLRTFERRIMPNTLKLAAGAQGQKLEGYASPPLCCPSRAGFLTGQYPQNHGVLKNDWAELREPDNTLPAWLQAAGYNTGFAGKYLNGYKPGAKPAAGFDSWFGFVGKPGYFDYKASRQGDMKRYGDKREDYSTTVITDKSRGFIRRKAESSRPFFLWTSYYAPHGRRSDHPSCKAGAPEPLAKDWRRFRDARVELPPSFNEKDVSDKPSRVRRARLRRGYAQFAKDRIRCTYAALQEVDRGIGDLQRTLKKLRIDDETIIFYTSDNGLFFGEHRLNGKSLPYVEAVRVPFVVNVPRRFIRGQQVAPIREPVANIDLAPTILDFAGGEPCTARGACRVMDGRSLVGPMQGDLSGWPRPRPIGVRLGEGCGAYRAVFQRSDVYVEYLRRVRGACKVAGTELYDLVEDPFQLRNRLFKPTDGAIDDAERLHEVVARLWDCAGIEGRDPPQAGRPFC